MFQHPKALSLGSINVISDTISHQRKGRIPQLEAENAEGIQTQFSTFSYSLFLENRKQKDQEKR